MSPAPGKFLRQQSSVSAFTGEARHEAIERANLKSQTRFKSLWERNWINRFTTPKEETGYQRYCHQYLMQAQVAMRIVVVIHLVVSVIDIMKFRAFNADKEQAKLREYDQKSEWAHWWYLLFSFPFAVVPRQLWLCEEEAEVTFPHRKTFCQRALLALAWKPCVTWCFFVLMGGLQIRTAYLSDIAERDFEEIANVTGLELRIEHGQSLSRVVHSRISLIASVFQLRCRLQGR